LHAIKYIVCLIAVLLPASILLKAQQVVAVDSFQQKYLQDQKKLGQVFTSFYYPDFSTINSLPEKEFVFTIDSCRNVFNNLLNTYSAYLNKEFVLAQHTEIKYYFDRIILDYPANHSIYTGKTVVFSAATNERLKKNLYDFNNPALLGNPDFRDYVKAWIYHRTKEELKRTTRKTSDNQYLNVAWQLIPALFTSATCRDFWKYDYLFNHIDNIGITNVEKIYSDFLLTCKDTASVNKIRTIYAEDSTGRTGHLIRTYKVVNGFNLKMHVFLPDSSFDRKRPAIVFFHGGSWSEGKPDWFFESCKSYAGKGWVACAVEYRILARHNTLPFEAVKDARSAIRWVRQQAAEYFIDTNRIVASGNSAGGHLVLATVLAEALNEQTDDLRYNATPNVALINSGVYDLTDRNTAWIGATQKNKNIVKQISPVHLVKKVSPYFLILHGTNDKNCPFPDAAEFVQQMKKAGNNIEFAPMEGAGHFIWYDRAFAGRVASLRSDFLKKLGY
jgi:acetyl esterase/lipase